MCLIAARRLFLSQFKSHKRSVSSFAINNNHPLISCKEVSQDIFVISEKYFVSWNKANFFLVRGAARDLLIDAGTGIHDCRRFLLNSKLISDEKQLDLVLTHCHFDHSGGIRHFLDKSDVHIHPSESAYVRNANLSATAAWITPDEVLPKPDLNWSHRNFYHGSMGRELKAVDEGRVFDLGNRKFEVLHLPGHTCGSIALLDEAEGVLATGDTLYQTDGELIDWYPPCSSVEQMRASVSRILDLATSGRLSTVLPGHNDCIHGSTSIAEAACRHLDMVDRRRMYKKAFSRARAKIILEANATWGKMVPQAAKEWITN